MVIQVLTRDFGGGALTRAALVGDVPAEWYAPVPTTADGWRDASRRVAADFAGRGWLDAIAPALQAHGAAAERLARVVAGDGIVVTTGQQPGLFGGPIYTWSKAFTAVVFADELERQLGLPVVPVFWAATDDADFAEASYTVVALNGAARVLRLSPRDGAASMAATPLGDVHEQYAQLAAAAGSMIDPEPLAVTREAYQPTATIGDAYVTLLRRLLEPLGMPVLDAAHPVVRRASTVWVREALRRAAPVRDAVAERASAIEGVGYKVQVPSVPNLSLVFRTTDGIRARVPVKAALDVAGGAPDEELGPNVLLRPVIERQLLPTVAYVAGPAEYAYFAQVSAVADALGLARPRAVPRWSGLILEPHVQEILQSIGASADDFRDPHALEGRVARAELSVPVRDAIRGLRGSLQGHVAALRALSETPLELRNAVDGFERQVEHRIARLERRYAAAVKRSGNARLHAVSVARASLYPNGVPQERALNLLPFLARYGGSVRDEMLARAREHASTLVGCD